MNSLLQANGQLDGTSMLAHAIGVWRAYDLNQISINDYITRVGGGAIRRMDNFVVSILRPRYYIWTNDNELYVHIAGTQLEESNLAHLWADLAGYIIRDSTEVPNVAFHGYFLDAAREIVIQVRNLQGLAAVPRYRMMGISGHSYGGAVAQIAALLLARRYPAARVELFTVGSPKPMRCEIGGPLVDRSAIVYHQHDPVADAPSDSQSVALFAFGAALEVYFGVQEQIFYHIGRAYKISLVDIEQRGRLNRPYPSDRGFPIFGDHLMQSYRDSINAYRRRQLALTVPDNFELWAYDQAILEMPVDDIPSPAIRMIPSPVIVNREFFEEDSPIDPVNQAGIPFLVMGEAFAEVSETPLEDNIEPLEFSGDLMGLYKFTFHTHDMIYGSTSSMIFSFPTDAGETTLKDVAGRWIKRFSRILSNPNNTRPNDPARGYPQVMAVQVTNLAQRNNTLLFLGPFGGDSRPPVWQGEEGSQAYNSGVNLRMQSSVVVGAQTYTSVSNLWLPSPPDDVISNDIYVPDGNTTTTAPVGTYQAMADLFVTYLRRVEANVTDTWGHMGINPSIPLLNLTNAVIDLNGQWTFQCPVNALVVTRAIIQISTANASNWNGQYRITNVTGTTVQIAGGPAINAPGFTSANGYVTRNADKTYNTVYYTYTRLLTAKYSSHRPAKPFSPVSFRRGKRKRRVAR